MTRRTATQAAAATALSYSRILGANDRVRMGYVGLGNRGDQVHDAFLEYADQETAAVCDIKESYMDFAVKKSRATPKKYLDYRKLLDDKSVDAVAIATPDHWHALQFIEACRAGKDVYVEKPLSLTVVEGRRMVEVARETRRVTQVGLQRRSSKFLQEAAQFVRGGGIGKVTFAQAWHTTNEWPDGLGRASMMVMPDFDWDQWLGPAPAMPYSAFKGHYTFRWFFPFSGGQLTNMGVHYMDTMRWMLGKESPAAVTALGGKFAGIRDEREIPDTLQVTWDFADTLMLFTQINGNAAPGNIRGAEMVLRGTKGTMYLGLNGCEVVPEQNASMPIPSRTPLDRETERSYPTSRRPAMEAVKFEGRVSNAPHARNFLDCVKSRAQCNCDILTGHVSTSNTLIGNIAYKTRALLEWDAAAERFPRNADANKLLHYDYRPPYQLG
jgi:predicted dehydrogenase